MSSFAGSIVVMTRFIISGVLASIFIFPTWARAIPTDFEGWWIFSSFISLDDEKRYQLYLETQPRIGADWTRVPTVQSRVGLQYKWTKHFTSMVGYAWTPLLYNAQYHRTFIDENRLWQQVAYRHELFGVSWQHRVRQEQRFIVGSHPTSNRTRYQLRGSYGLSDDKSVGLTWFDEIMVNLNSANPQPYGGFDRNRIFLGPYLVVDGHRYEVGYLGEYQKRFGDEPRWANVIAFHAIFNF